MKAKLQQLSCLIWIVVILGAGGTTGWCSNQAMNEIFGWIGWIPIVLSTAAGIGISVLLSWVSFLMLDNSITRNNPK